MWDVPDWPGDWHRVVIASVRRQWRLVGLAFAAAALVCSACTDTITMPSPPTTETAPVTETMTSAIGPQGSAFRQFTASQAGTVTVRLASVSEPIAVGVGVGVPGSTGSPCLLSTAVSTKPGADPHVSVPVDAGFYCAGVYDVGQIGSADVAFSIEIVHP